MSKELVKALHSFKISKDTLLFPLITKTLVKDGLMEGIDTRKPKKNYFKKIKSSINYIINNFEDPNLTIKQIAEESEYSYTYFTKAFTMYMHETPINYLNRVRLSKAKELMKDKNLSLKEISNLSGFKNISTFTESFKRIVGMLPKDYRKKYIMNWGKTYENYK